MGGPGIGSDRLESGKSNRRLGKSRLRPGGTRRKPPFAQHDDEPDGANACSIPPGRSTVSLEDTARNTLLTTAVMIWMSPG